jgi:hypothetical protein
VNLDEMERVCKSAASMGETRRSGRFRETAVKTAFLIKKKVQAKIPDGLSFNPWFSVRLTEQP